MDPVISWPTHPRKQEAGEVPLRHRTSVSPLPNRKVRSPPSVHVPSLIRPALGPLECEALQQVCGLGESSARQVLERMPRPVAYTTVMTTLTRLHRKGFLNCRASGRTFFYSSRLSSAQLELQLARDLARALMGCDHVQPHELATTIVETMRVERPQLWQELKRALL